MALAKKPAAPAATNYPVIKDRATIAIVDEYYAKKCQSELLESRLKELKPRIEAAMVGAPVAYAGSRVVNLTEFREIPATDNVVITKGMIGQVIPGKKGRVAYTQLKVT